MRPKQIPRNSDGSIVRRKGDKPKLMPRTEIARWVEVNAVRMRRIGLSFQKIAETLTAAGRGGDTADVEMPPAGVQFPMDYSITPLGVYQAYAKVIDEA